MSHPTVSVQESLRFTQGAGTTEATITTGIGEATTTGMEEVTTAGMGMATPVVRRSTTTIGGLAHTVRTTIGGIVDMTIGGRVAVESYINHACAWELGASESYSSAA